MVTFLKFHCSYIQIGGGFLGNQTHMHGLRLTKSIEKLLNGSVTPLLRLGARFLSDLSSSWVKAQEKRLVTGMAPVQSLI